VRLFVDENGNPYRDVPEDHHMIIEAYRMMERDLIYGERRILQKVEDVS